MNDETKLIKLALVDDHVLMRAGVAEVISRFDDCKVILLAGNGKELFANLQKDNLPDLVLLDLNMPEMDGYETATRLRTKYPGIHILILTMYDSELVTIRLLQAGARGVLTKDCHPSELRRAITTIMQSGYYYSESTTSRIAHLLKNTDNKTTSVMLTENELRFLQLASTDITYKDIAKIMKISPRTVDNYRDAVFPKLGVKSRIGLVLYAISNGLTRIDY
jgi:two-component system invasion response regulator UvrY